MKKILNFLKSNYKKIIVSVSCLTLLLVIGFSFLKPKQVNASVTIDLKDYYKNYFDNDYFDNANNKLFKSSRANFSYYNINEVGDNAFMYFGIGNYTTNDFNSYAKYEFYDKYISGNAIGKVGQFQRSESGLKTVFYTNTLGNYLKINFKDIIIPFGKVGDDFNIENFDGVITWDIFSTSLSEYFNSLYLYSNSSSATATYSLLFTLNAYNEIKNINDSYSVEGGLVNVSTVDKQYQSLDNIFNADYIKDAFISFTDYIDYDYKVLLPSFNIVDCCSTTPDKMPYNYYYVLPNLELTISLSDDINSYFYFVEDYNNSLNNFYDFEFQRYLNLFAIGDLYPDNVYPIYELAYSDGQSSGYELGYNSGVSVGYNEGYNEGYNVGFDYGYKYSSPFELILGTVESFFNFEIFPSFLEGVDGFRVYHLLLFGLGVSIIGIILKLALGG